MINHLNSDDAAFFPLAFLLNVGTPGSMLLIKQWVPGVLCKSHQPTQGILF